MSKEINLLQLSDCVLITLLRYLDATSLYQLSQTCTYLNAFINDPELWRYVDARNEPNTVEKVGFCTDKIDEKTTHVMFRASDKSSSVSLEFFKKIEGFTNITVMALENQKFNANFITYHIFPEFLEELSLRKTYVKNSRNFFRLSKNRAQRLKVLVLDDCQWLQSSSLMSLANFPSLEVLSVVNCPKFPGSAMPYLSISLHGYKVLKVFDCRFTELGNSLLSIQTHLPELMGFYFQSPASYDLDYSNQTTEYLVNNLKNKQETAKKKRWMLDDMGTDELISDSSLINYILTMGGNKLGALPNCQLYQDPYPECTCGKGSGDFPTIIEETTQKQINELLNDTKKWAKRRRSSNEDTSSSDEGEKHDGVIVLQVLTVEAGPSNRAAPTEQPSGAASPPLPRDNARKRKSDESQPGPSGAKRLRTSNSSSDEADDDAAPAKLIKRLQKSRANKRARTASTSSEEESEATRSKRSFPISQYFMCNEHMDSPSLLSDIVAQLEFKNILVRNLSPLVNGQKKIKLRRLSLRGYRLVTDLGLHFLKNLKLDLLDLTYTGVTRKGIERFLVDNPYCRIIHPQYCVCTPRL